MASSTPASPDSPVTLKVSFQGTTRRLTLPLSEVSSITLLDKIRQSLSISPESTATFERHSDSAAAYIELEPDNTPVWKQLYRAAKAKRKLKLRVTLHEPEDEEEQEEEEDDEVNEEETTGPKPVSVEDVVEDESSQQSFQDSNSTETSALENAMNNMHLRPESKEQDHTLPSTQVCGSFKRANFAVCCNNCDRTIPDEHYHCSTCDEGDFDLCLDCVHKGVSCYSDDHWMLKRTVKGDFIVVSTTDRVSPKPKVKTEDSEIKVEPEVKKDEIEHDNTCNHQLSQPCQPFQPVYSMPRAFSTIPEPMRTCNSCVQELPDYEFLHCLSCDDFDLCKGCFRSDQHGHHPQHAFAPAVEGTPVSSDIQTRLAPGRYQRHHAICDGCDKFIYGIRHKCMDCPDWDYCSDCHLNAGFVHPNHRFVPIYEQSANTQSTAARPCHYGICCDGPLCNGSRKTYIVGDRFKCAVCHDTDFCANCEANPGNTHNKTHPLIKFKTPVRRVEVKTKNETENGQRTVMGDRLRPKPTTPVAQSVPPQYPFISGPAAASIDSLASTSAAQTSSLDPITAQNERILTLAKLRQQAMIARQRQDALIISQRQEALVAKERGEEAAAAQEKLVTNAALYAKHLAQARLQNEQIQQNNRLAILQQQKKALAEAQRTAMLQRQQQLQFEQMAQRQATAQAVAAQALAAAQAKAATTAAKANPIAIFERDTIADGTVMAPNHVFEQTWVLRNGGDAPWPAGCSVKFVGGDYMGHVDSSHPAGIHDLVSASESTVCYDALAPGQEFPFTVLLRTPAREGKVISYWRLQSDDGLKFGHRLWCDVSVQKPKAAEALEVVEAPEEAVKSSDASVQESAASSQMIFPKLDSSDNLPATTVTEDAKDAAEVDYTSPDEYDFETIDEDETWAEDSDDGILTDEDYDILDASDEEYIDEQLKKTQK